MRAATLALLSLVLFADPVVAQSHTRSISSMGHMAVTADGSGVYAIENGGALAFHSATTAGAWQEPIGPSVCPCRGAPGLCTCSPPLPLFPITGVVVAHAATGDL